MKTIILFRHGKSDWDADTGDDHARPLADRGRKGARKMGRFLVTAGSAPDHAVSSSAVRTRQTLAIAAAEGGWTGDAHVTDALYGASPEDVVREVQAVPDDASTVVVVGHEPTTSRVASLLIGGGRLEVKTATMVRIDVDVDRWADVHPGRGALVWMLSPGHLKPNRYRKLQQAMQQAKEAAAAAAEIAVASQPDPPAEADDAADGDGPADGAA